MRNHAVSLTTASVPLPVLNREKRGLPELPPPRARKGGACQGQRLAARGPRPRVRPAERRYLRRPRVPQPPCSAPAGSAGRPHRPGAERPSPAPPSPPLRGRNRNPQRRRPGGDTATLSCELRGRRLRVRHLGAGGTVSDVTWGGTSAMLGAGGPHSRPEVLSCSSREGLLDLLM